MSRGAIRGGDAGVPQTAQGRRRCRVGREKIEEDRRRGAASLASGGAAGGEDAGGGDRREKGRWVKCWVKMATREGNNRGVRRVGREKNIISGQFYK